MQALNGKLNSGQTTASTAADPNQNLLLGSKFMANKSLPLNNSKIQTSRPSISGRPLPMPPEGFRHISQYPGYAVSSQGDVVCCIKPVQGRPFGEWRQRKLRPDANGYLRVDLRCDHQVRSMSMFVHVLVLEAFRRTKPKGYQSRHLNGIRSDNRLENLKWATPKVNNADKIEHGTLLMGSKHPRSKLTELKVKEIRERHKNGETIASISRELQMNDSHIGMIISRRAWRHV